MCNLIFDFVILTSIFGVVDSLVIRVRQSRGDSILQCGVALS